MCYRSFNTIRKIERETSKIIFFQQFLCSIYVIVHYISRQMCYFCICRNLLGFAKMGKDMWCQGELCICLQMFKVAGLLLTLRILFIEQKMGANYSGFQSYNSYRISTAVLAVQVGQINVFFVGLITTLSVVNTRRHNIAKLPYWSFSHYKVDATIFRQSLCLCSIFTAENIQISFMLYYTFSHFYLISVVCATQAILLFRQFSPQIVHKPLVASQIRLGLGWPYRPLSPRPFQIYFDPP